MDQVSRLEAKQINRYEWNFSRLIPFSFLMCAYKNHIPDFEITSGTHGREDLVNATTTSNAEEEEEEEEEEEDEEEED